MAVSGLDSVIGQSLSGLNISSGGSAGAGGVSGMSLQMPAQSRNVSNNTDIVTLSNKVPEPISSATVELAGTISGKLAEDYSLTRKETAAIKESRVLAALTGMKLLQSNSGKSHKVWMGGVPRPTADEMEEAYKRLTQKLSDPSNSKAPQEANALRMELLEKFRNIDFKAEYGSEPPATTEAAAASESITETTSPASQEETAAPEISATEESNTPAAPVRTTPIRLVA